MKIKTVPITLYDQNEKYIPNWKLGVWVHSADTTAWGLVMPDGRDTHMSYSLGFAHPKDIIKRSMYHYANGPAAGDPKYKRFYFLTGDRQIWAHHKDLIEACKRLDIW